VKAPDAARVKRLLADLGSERFAVRQRATDELERLAELAEPALRQLLATDPPLEVRQRLQALLKRLEWPVSDPEALRGLRALEALERIATAEARQVLTGLAGGAPDARLTREASEALRRLGKRPAP
jgi:hypothetical protein